MSSEAITRNDLSAILNEVLPPTPSEYQKLLWTNPNPTSAFAPQTISLDLSNYDAVDVEFRHWTNKDCRVITRNYLNEGEGVGIGISTDASSYGNYRRGFKMYTNGVQFWGGTSNANVDNNSTIPVRIWGIKYERVAPPQTEYYTPKEFETAWNTHSAGYYTANCVQIGDLKIQWGILQAQSGSFHSVYFKVPFEGLGYFASASYTSNGDVTISPNPNAYITGQHTDYCRVRTNGGVYCWLCIGY